MENRNCCHHNDAIESMMWHRAHLPSIKILDATLESTVDKHSMQITRLAYRVSKGCELLYLNWICNTFPEKLNGNSLEIMK